MPSVKVVNGKQIVVEALDPGQRFKRFLAKPLLQMRYNREIILAILRRELASRFTGSAGGWLWAVAAPLFAIAVYTFAFTTKLQMTFVGEQGQAPISYALFIFSRPDRLQLLLGDGVPLADAAARVRPLHQADDLPQRHAGGHLDPARRRLHRHRRHRHADLHRRCERRPALDGDLRAADLHPAGGVPDGPVVVPVRDRRLHARCRLPDDQHRAAVHVPDAGVLHPHLAAAAVGLPVSTRTRSPPMSRSCATSC